jgi:ribosomal protein S18 acetylase RimI-like enzyme
VIRPARPGEAEIVANIVATAYRGYIARIGKEPGPMLDDYAALVAAGQVHAMVEPDGEIAGLIVLIAKPDHLLLDNVAVRPDRQGRGIGRALIAFAEAEAHRRGFAELRLYTHAKMVENIALYLRLGFAETGRGRQAGYDRVFMAKRVGTRDVTSPQYFP